MGGPMGSGAHCSCNSLCPMVNGKRACHLKAKMHAPIEGLPEHLQESQADYVGKESAETEVLLSSRFEGVVIDVCAPGEEPRAIKIAIGQRAVINVDGSGLVTSVTTMLV